MSTGFLIYIVNFSVIYYFFIQSYRFKRPILPFGPGPKPPLKNHLPQASGDNKLTEQMVPGYTGTAG